MTNARHITDPTVEKRVNALLSDVADTRTGVGAQRTGLSEGERDSMVVTRSLLASNGGSPEEEAAKALDAIGEAMTGTGDNPSARPPVSVPRSDAPLNDYRDMHLIMLGAFWWLWPLQATCDVAAQRPSRPKARRVPAQSAHAEVCARHRLSHDDQQPAHAQRV